MRPFVARRFAKTVPLAAVVAVGVAGAGLMSVTSAGAGSTVAAASPAPTAVVAPAAAEATPSAAPTATPAPAAPSAAPATPAAEPVPAVPAVAPAKAPAKKAVPAQQPSTRPAAPATAQPAAPAEPHSGDVGVEFRSLADGQHVKAGSGYVDFEVVLTNRSSAAYEQVAPVVQSLAFDRSADCSGCNAYAHGTLDRKDAAGWKAVKLVQDGERNDAEGGAFALAPGESRTVKYRLTLAGDNTGGRLPITADAYVAYGSGRTKAGSAGVRLDVENQSVVKVELSKPTDMTIGHVPTQLNVRLTNADGAASHVVTPYITGIDPLGPQLQHGMKPQDLTAEVQLNGEWKTLAGAFDDQGMIRIDTSSLARTLAPGESVSFDFRFGLPKGWIAGNGLELTVGAESDGVRGTLQTVRPRAFTPMADLPKWDFSTNSPIA